MTDPLARHDVGLVRAGNPGPFTLTGTNTWLVDRDPCWVIDPGPALPGHLDATLEAAAQRGGIAGIAVTHSHPDHVEGVEELRARAGGPQVAAARSPAGAAAGSAQWLTLGDGDRIGPLVALATPGHAPDHLSFVAGAVCFTGDAVLGEGSVFISPDPGALRGYLDALRRLRELDLELICPGHGPPVTDPAAKLDEYIAHRLDREGRLVAALEAGRRSVDELLDEAWSDVPGVLRPAAAVTLAAHLDKLEEEGRLPGGVERPAWPG